MRPATRGQPGGAKAGAWFEGGVMALSLTHGHSERVSLLELRGAIEHRRQQLAG